MASKRESNFELMRIVAIVMIILHHVVVHCFYPQMTDSSLMAKFDNGLFCNPEFYPQLLIPEALAPLGKTGVALFMLLSGYFMVGCGRDTHLARHMGKLLGQVAFATLALMGASLVYYRCVGTYVPVLKLNTFNDGWWFVGFYACIIALGTAGMNRWLDGLSREAYLGVLAGGFAVAGLGWSGALLNSLGDGLRTLAAGLLCYAGGGFLRKFNPLGRVRVWVLVLIVLIVYALMGLSYYDAVITTVDDYLRGDGSGLYIQPVNTNSYLQWSVAPFVLGVSIFELFRRLKFKPNRIINGIASATFMIYLIHDNELIRNFWKHRVDLVTLLYRTPLKFCLAMTLRMLSVLAIGLAAYGAYRALLWGMQRLKPVFLKP